MKVLAGEIIICAIACLLTFYVAPDKPKVWGAAWVIFFAYHIFIAMPSLFGKKSANGNKTDDELNKDESDYLNPTNISYYSRSSEELNPYNVNDPNDPML